MAKSKKKNKYLSKKVMIDGIKFSSKKEAQVYLDLKDQKEKKAIKDFGLQPRFLLINKFQTEDGEKFRAIHYTADYRVIYLDDSEEILEVKGIDRKTGKPRLTEASALRIKLFRYFYPDLNFKII